MIYRFGDVVLDTTAFVLTRDGQEVHLPPKALQLLACLIEERPRALSKQELHDRIWPETYVVESSLRSSFARFGTPSESEDTRSSERFIDGATHSLAMSMSRRRHMRRGRRGVPISFR